MDTYNEIKKLRGEIAELRGMVSALTEALQGLIMGLAEEPDTAEPTAETPAIAVV